MSVSEPTDVRSLAEIFKAGDFIIANPAETCIIFVVVIIISALLEYGIQMLNNKIENKYAKMILDTMAQELTIVGVLALLLMLATSLTPSGEQQDRMSTLFTWANMNLFFMAFFFVCIVIVQFAFAAYSIPKWRQFEEGRMDAEEISTLAYPERTYKIAFERYSEELFFIFNIPSTECAFYEIVQVYMRKILVRLGNLTWPVWLGLIPVIAVNGVRAYFTPYTGDTQQGAFLNTLMYMAATGYFTMFAFLGYFALLQRRMGDIINKRVKRSVKGVDHLPFGSIGAGVWFIQVVLMCLNWYITLFITGIARDAFQRAAQWQSAILAIIFVIPVAVVHFLIPWTLFTLSMMSVFGSIETSKSSIERIVRRHKGDFDEQDSDTTEDEEVAKKKKDGESDDEPESPEKAVPPTVATAGKKAPPPGMMGKKKMPPPAFAGKKGMPPPGAKGPPGKGPPRKGPGAKMPPPSSSAKSKPVDKNRPSWLEDDEPWGNVDELADNLLEEQGGNNDGQTIDASNRYDFLYYETMDGRELREMIRKEKDAADVLDELEADDEMEGGNGNFDDDDAHLNYDENKKPTWMDSDDDWP